VDSACRGLGGAAADHLLALAKNRYQAGITTYLEVVIAQSAALANQRTAVQLLTRRMTASVSLLEALGGGWRESDLAGLPPPRTLQDASIEGGVATSHVRTP
jgi:hypothetical protein